MTEYLSMFTTDKNLCSQSPKHFPKGLYGPMAGSFFQRYF